MNKIYYLSTCDTCKKILAQLELPPSVVLQDIKKEPLTEGQLDEMKNLAGSYEALFSKRARMYKERGLKNKPFNEQDFRDLILEHYTFLKRPVLLLNGQIFVGNSKKVVDTARNAVHG